jgi:hypothetical protein
MPTIPKLSAPLVKDIRTGEGILEWLLALGDLLAGVTGNLSISHTLLYGTIVAAMKSVRRLLLKAVAAQGTVGIGAPVQPAILGRIGSFEPAAAVAVTDALAEIDAVKAVAQAIQATRGAPAETITTGLAPTPPTPSPVAVPDPATTPAPINPAPPPAAA